MQLYAVNVECYISILQYYTTYIRTCITLHFAPCTSLCMSILYVAMQ